MRIVDSTVSTVDNTVDKSIYSVNQGDEVSTHVVTVNRDAWDDVHHLDDGSIIVHWTAKLT